ncbi:hypothetical protein ACFW04_014701 [Cataglyphis niger]
MKKDGRKLKEEKSSKFRCHCMPARRENRKGRAKGGIITAVNKSLQEVSIRDMSYQAVEIKLRYNGNRWKIITIYSQDVEETMQTIKEQIQEKKEEHLVIGRDFNARTDNGGGPMREEDDKIRETKKSIDKMVNREGMLLVEKIEERGWMILIGSFNNKRVWTYISERGASVVDYIERNHVPLEVELEGPETNIIRQETKTKVIEKSDWIEERKESYHVKCEGWKSTQIKNNNIWKELKEKVKKWNKKIISPIYKKGEKSEVKNYRGVTLMDTAYKICRNNGRTLYVLNYTINNELRKKGEKIFVFFADLRAAFDKIDRKKLNERMEKIGVENHLRRIMETYKETINIVKVGNRKTEAFWMEKGVRRGYPISPSLFNIYKNREWKWGEKSIEKVKEIKYLSYILQKNGGAEKQVRERLKRAMIRLFKNDYRRRAKMFDALVGSVALYGAEMWGWKNEVRLDRIKRKYINEYLDRRTPNYILVEETKMIELRIEAMRRVIKYEEKARNSNKKIVIKCIKDLKREKRKRREQMEATRRTLLKRIGMEKEELKKKREERNQEIVKIILEKIWRKEKKEGQNKINESYNNMYKDIITEDLPKYRGRGKERIGV